MLFLKTKAILMFEASCLNEKVLFPEQVKLNHAIFLSYVLCFQIFEWIHLKLPFYISYFCNFLKKFHYLNYITILMYDFIP